MNFSIAKLAAVSTMIISFVGQCACNDEECPGTYTDTIVGVDSAMVIFYNYPREGSTRYQNGRIASSVMEVSNAGLDGDSVISAPTRWKENNLSTDVEVRLVNEWSSGLKNPLLIIKDETTTHDCPEEDSFDDATYVTKEIIRKVDSSMITMPPVYLHLFCRSFSDTEFGQFERYGNIIVKAKKWEFVSITDDQGVDLTGTPEWGCMVDNTYWFCKDMNVAYDPGNVVCQGERSREHIIDTYLHFPYSIEVENPGNMENPGEISIYINPGNYIDGISGVRFNVENSSYNQISGTIEVEGRTARYVIQPE